MTTARGYDAMREDPDIYKTLDFCGYSASRYFPDMQLPVPRAPSVSDSAQQSTQCQFVPEHLISVIQGMYDEHVHFLKPLGRDPCSYFKEKDEARILRALGPNVVVCPFCNRKCRSPKISESLQEAPLSIISSEVYLLQQNIWGFLCFEDPHEASFQL